MIANDKYSTGPNLLNTNFNFCNARTVYFSLLLSKNSTFIEIFSIKNPCGKSSIPRYLNLPIKLYNWFPLVKMESNRNLFPRPGDLNNVQLTEIRDIHEQCEPLDTLYLVSPWWWVA